MKTLATVTIEETTFTLQKEGINHYLVSAYDETPVSVERVEYNERDSVTTISMEDAPYGLIDAKGSDTLAVMACDELEDLI